MSESVFSSINGFSKDVANPNSRILDTIKTSSQKTGKVLDQKTVEASATASEYTKAYANKSFKLELTSTAVREGPYYAKPQ